MRALLNVGFVGDETGHLRHAVTKAARQIVAALRGVVGSSYRPEKHYMRGPGPKAREKQQVAFRSDRL